MITALRLGLSLFSVAPVRVRAELGPGQAAGALLWLPVIGAALGAVAALPASWIRDADPHADVLGAIIAVALLALATRGLHLDGLADTADGLGSAAPAPRALQIMRQSDIGAFGVITLVLVLGAQIAALGTMRGGIWVPVAALATAAGTGRVAAVLAAVRGVPAAHRNGFGALVAGRIAPVLAAAEIIAVLGFGALLAFSVRVPIGWFLAPQAVALAATALLRAHTSRRFGGITGDVFGALIELGTAITLVGIALR